MTKTATSKKKSIQNTAKTDKKKGDVTVDRRREWRLDLPLTAAVEGTLPEEQSFREETILENISSTGAYFCLNSGVTVGSRLTLVIEIPDKLTEGKKLKLRLKGITIRLEEPLRMGKKQGVALRFDEEFHFIGETSA
ncbi:MAG: PilZ domain-containing protein [Candidatus Aminicenantes bacterium]|nr:PilZ domain-containing protein [Candidatus Aminicenantes bacterium]